MIIVSRYLMWTAGSKGTVTLPVSWGSRHFKAPLKTPMKKYGNRQTVAAKTGKKTLAISALLLVLRARSVFEMTANEVGLNEVTL